MPEKALSETFRHLQEPRQRRYVIVHQTLPSVPVRRVEYDPAVLETVRALTIAQLCFGITIMFFHIITTVMGDNFYNQLSLLKVKLNEATLDFDTDFPDHAGTGVWVGLLAIVAAGIGFGAYKKQTKGFILLHLVLNVALLLCSLILIITLSVNIHRISSCRRNGLNFERDVWPQKTNSTTQQYSTTTPEVYLFFGEEINDERRVLFHCQHKMFKNWMGLDAFLILCSVTEFFILLALLLYNSTAACFCCRKVGCCGKCCTCCYGESDNVEGQMVSYCTESTDPSVIPSVPMASLDAVAGIIVPSSAMPPYVQQSALALTSPSQLSHIDAMFTNMTVKPQTAI